MKKPAMLFGLVFCLLGCQTTAGYRYASIPAESEARLPGSVETKVPHIAQMDSYSCATTSVAMAVSCFLGMIDEPLDKDAAWAISGTDIDTVHSRGNDMLRLKSITDHFGLKAEFMNRMTLFELKYLLSIGALVVVNIRPELGSPMTHAVLAVGYDEDAGRLRFMDTSVRNPEYSMEYLEFLKHWNGWLSNPMIESERCGFIVYPPDASSGKH